MALINVLPPEISNKIAAGEVVERPASVVKELVENSIDAGADKITIEIKNGGATLISVTDNGKGMAAEDAEIAFLRHATSKIRTEEDLGAIYTLGFRGEALSSIGAVSKCAIYTKQKAAEFGTCVTCEGGEIIASEESGMSDGTKIVVRDLFYNTPARMKFLKKDATEAGYINDIVARFILAHPEISFRLIKNGKDAVISGGDGSLKNAIYSVYGRDYANSLLEINYEADNLKITGAVGKGFLARPNRNFQSFFVNSRYIKSPLIIRALEEAFKNQIMIGKFPFAVLNIEVNPALIDINVHPTKLEVKFSDDKKIYDLVYYGVKNALYEKPIIPEIEKKEKKTERVNPFINKENAKTIEEQIKIEEPKKEEILKDAVKKEEFAPLPNEFVQKEDKKAPEKEIKIEIKKPVADPLDAFKKKDEIQKPVFCEPKLEVKIIEEKKEEPKEEQKEEQNKEIKPQINEEKTELPIKVVGNVFDTYIIAQQGDKMLLIDQHAAHERVKYEQLLKETEAKELYPQILLEPVIVRLSGTELSAFESGREELNELGFESDLYGESEVIIRTSPQDVEIGDVEDLFLELLGELSNSKKNVVAAKKQRLLYTIACKSAVKANHVLTFGEMESLVKAVLDMKNINTCPHGRPIIVTMSKKELEKQFKRIV